LGVEECRSREGAFGHRTEQMEATEVGTGKEKIYVILQLSRIKFEIDAYSIRIIP
jgi:hypothetical protein